MPKNDNKEPDGESKIHEPLSSYYPPPFKVEKMTLQNLPPKYHGHGAVYVKNDEYEDEPGKTE